MAIAELLSPISILSVNPLRAKGIRRGAFRMKRSLGLDELKVSGDVPSPIKRPNQAGDPLAPPARPWGAARTEQAGGAGTVLGNGGGNGTLRGQAHRLRQIGRTHVQQAY